MNDEDQQIERKKNKMALSCIHSFKFRQLTSFVTMTLTLFTWCPLLSYAESKNRECLGRHLREARYLNEQRKPLYGDATNGQSFEISNQLIQNESVALFWGPLFFNFDRWAIPYQNLGVDIVCDDFISMQQTPSFTAKRAGPFPSLKNFRHPGSSSLKRELKKAMNDGFRSVEIKADELIHQLNSSFPLGMQMNCMTRHLLESIRLIARNAPHHIAKHRQLDPQRQLQSPSWISKKMIRSHLLYLADAETLDRLAAPIQADGVPIICNDVPPIP